MRNEKQVIFSPATLTNYTSLSFLLLFDNYKILCIILYCTSPHPSYSQGFYPTLCLYFCNRNPMYKPWTWAWSLSWVVSHPAFPGWVLGSSAYLTEWPTLGWGSGKGIDPDKEKAEVFLWLKVSAEASGCDPRAESGHIQFKAFYVCVWVTHWCF